MSGCRCDCGYRCGGPGRCALDPFTCLQQPKGSGHFEKDCDHVWDGPAYESADGCVSSATCSRCGDVAIYHDMRTGP